MCGLECLLPILFLLAAGGSRKKKSRSGKFM